MIIIVIVACYCGRGVPGGHQAPPPGCGLQLRFGQTPSSAAGCRLGASLGWNPAKNPFKTHEFTRGGHEKGPRIWRACGGSEPLFGGDIVRMEPPEPEPRSDNEAEYEDEEVDPRIQVSGHRSEAGIMLGFGLRRSGFSVQRTRFGG